MDPDPAKHCTGLGNGGVCGEGLRWDCPAPGPGGRWSRGSRVHCPREGAMFLLPRHSQMAAGDAEPKQTKAPGPGETGGGGQGEGLGRG